MSQDAPRQEAPQPPDLARPDLAWPDLAGRFDGRIHRLGIRIYYEDTDFSGVVYHANYLRFAERGRSDFLRLAGIGHRELMEADRPLAFAIHKMELSFLVPARIDDVLEVATVYRAARGARIEAEQVIYRREPGGDGAELRVGQRAC